MTTDFHLTRLIKIALSEDLGSGDLTSLALFSKKAKGKAVIVAREPLVVFGLSVVDCVFQILDKRCQFKTMVGDGSKVSKGTVLAKLAGPLPSLLGGERTALNFLRHLSGIATLTRQYVGQLHKSKCTLLDTRKTTPGFRGLEKAAVRAGGGHNHRMGLFDGVMIKDNHIASAGSIRTAVQKAKKRIPPTVKIEVECDNLKQVRAALEAGADIIMLDNMSIKKMIQAVKLVGLSALTEASGTITLDKLEKIASTGVDYISVGAITHSAPNVDIAMDME